MPARLPRRALRLIVAAALLTIGTAAVAIAVDGEPARDVPDSTFVAEVRSGVGSDALYCSSFAVVEEVVATAYRDEHEPNPGGAAAPATNFIGLANALTVTRSEPLSPALAAATTAYAYALINLGAAINGGDSGSDVVEDLYQLTALAGRTVVELCPAGTTRTIADDTGCDQEWTPDPQDAGTPAAATNRGR